MKKAIWLLVGAFSLACCTKSETAGPDAVGAASETAASEDTLYVDGLRKGIINVKFSEDFLSVISSDLEAGSVSTKSSDLNQAMDRIGTVSYRRLFTDDPRYTERMHREGLDRWYTITFDESVDVPVARAALSEVEGIDMVDECRRLKSEAIFNDPYFSNQWALNNSTANADINVIKAWASYTTGSSNVVVGIVDTGVQYNHPDLAANYAGGYNFVRGNATISGESHGTHVAGIIAAVNDNGIGVCGVAGGDSENDGVRLMSLQIFDGNSSGSGADAIVYAANCGCNIVNNSWGYDYDYNGDGTLSGQEYTDAMAGTASSAVKEAVDYFVKYAGCDNAGNQLSSSPMQGGLVFFSAGNDGIANGAPANYEPIIAVGAIDSNGERSYFSNYGDFVDVCAPGSDIYSCLTTSTYGSMSGTSMSCPYATGVAALALSYLGGEGFTADMLKARIINGGNYDVSATNVGPLVDALGTITYGDDVTPGTVESSTVSVTANALTVKWNIVANSDGRTPYSYRVFMSTDKSAVESADVLNPSSSLLMSAVYLESEAIGDEVSVTFSDLDFSTDYYYAIAGISDGGTAGALSATASATTGENSAPVITFAYTGKTSFKAHESAYIPFTIEDPDGHSFTYTYRSGSSADSLSYTAVAGFRIVLDCSEAPAGTYTAIVTATDSYGLEGEGYFTYTLEENTAPEKLKDFDNYILTSVGNSVTLNLDEYFTDADGETLSYSISDNATSVVHATASTSSNSLIVTALGYGLATITVTATDCMGETCVSTFMVLVRNSDVVATSYPNPVTTTLYIATGEDDEPAAIRIVSQTGTIVYEATVTCSAFNPAAIDMTDVAPGVYKLTVKFGSKEYTTSITKK